MKRIYVNEEWCLGCHLCEYFCAYANSGEKSMVHALKNKPVHARVKVEGEDRITFAVSCRHCVNPACIAACRSGALSKGEDGVVVIDKEKCVGCGSCVMTCPYGAIEVSDAHVATKCELCSTNSFGKPLCVANCPNNAIVYEER